MSEHPFPRKHADSFTPEVQGVPPEVHQRLADAAALVGTGEPDPHSVGCVGFTMFDAPSSLDNLVTVLLTDEQIAQVPSQALVRIRSRDNRSYLGTVVAGPFAEPDGLRADSSILVTLVTRGGIFVPPYHGRVQVELLGEEGGGIGMGGDGNDTLTPPRYRPLPNSPVWVLDEQETARALRVEGDIQIGRVIGHDAVAVAIPSTRKDVLPRHTAVLGTTGGGKSTTVARLVQQAQAAGCAVIVLDVEGEYTFLHEPTSHPAMRAALERLGMSPAGVPQVTLYHLVGRETANPDHPLRREFCLQFARPSPYTVAEILDLTDAQKERFLQAYDIARLLLRDLGIFPSADPEQQRRALEYDEFDRGYPRLTLDLLMDVVAACAQAADAGTGSGRRTKRGPGPEQEQGQEEDPADSVSAFQPRTPGLQANPGLVFRRIAQLRTAGNTVSWRTLLGKLASLQRLHVFDPKGAAQPLRYASLLRPGAVSVVDLSDSGSPVLNNLVIADMLRGVQEAQEEAFKAFEQGRRAGRQDAAPPPRVLVVIEEAHEFLSGDRADKMPVLFEQVVRIARRGRKRWIGLVFVTQLPQHLPRQLFGLVNGYVLHKISDPQVVATLQRTVSGIDESLWRRLPGLAPGQAIVAFPHLSRPLLTAMDPSPAQLRLVD